MTNIIAFQPRPRVNQTHSIATLMQSIAHDRRPQEDVFWLKENAELLNVLASINPPITEDMLLAYSGFYGQLGEKLRFFPQYYRFFLSICLDLEDLGLPGTLGQTLCDWAAEKGLAQAELSDLQRAEAQRLLARRGAGEDISQGRLADRLRRFVERSGTFALPNKKAAYELTHIVFYLSEYGEVDPQLGEKAVQSLLFAGLLAYLDQDSDLLAEVCISLRYAGYTPSAIWTDTVAQAHRNITPISEPGPVSAMDGYHTYLVTGWAQEVAGFKGFETIVPEGPISFQDRSAKGGALRGLSSCLMELGSDRKKHWSAMKDQVYQSLDRGCQGILEQAEGSTDQFDAFFEEFSRASGF